MFEHRSEPLATPAAPLFHRVLHRFHLEIEGE